MVKDTVYVFIGTVIYFQHSSFVGHFSVKNALLVFLAYVHTYLFSLPDPIVNSETINTDFQTFRIAKMHIAHYTLHVKNDNFKTCS